MNRLTPYLESPDLELRESAGKLLDKLRRDIEALDAEMQRRIDKKC